LFDLNQDQGFSKSKLINIIQVTRDNR